LAGLRVGPAVKKANSAVTVFPTGTAPIRRHAATIGASASAAAAWSCSGDPCFVGQPATSMMSFTPNGTPASGPSGDGEALASYATHASISGSVAATRSRPRAKASDGVVAPAASVSISSRSD
jgi:hypothetical protein